MYTLYSNEQQPEMYIYNRFSGNEERTRNSNSTIEKCIFFYQWEETHTLTIYKHSSNISFVIEKKTTNLIYLFLKIPVLQADFRVYNIQLF